MEHAATGVPCYDHGEKRPGLLTRLLYKAYLANGFGWPIIDFRFCLHLFFLSSFLFFSPPRMKGIR